MLYLFAWVANSLVVFVIRIGFGRLFGLVWPSECQIMMRKRMLEKEQRVERNRNKKSDLKNVRTGGEEEQGGSSSIDDGGDEEMMDK